MLDGEKALALDVTRGLGVRGLYVSVAGRHGSSAAYRSRFVKRSCIYPDPATDAGTFVEWVREYMNRHSPELVMPLTDLTVLPLSASLSELRKFGRIAAETIERTTLVTDKQKTLELARSVKVPIPEGRVVADKGELEAAAGGLSYPVVCKPAKSCVWTPGSFYHLQVFYAFDREQLLTFGTSAVAVCPLILQEYRQGTGVGVEVLSRNGEILQLFQHERLHEVPVTGGGSTYRISVPVTPVLEEYARRLIEKLGWTGVAMVEFRLDKATGQATLMEVNGRFWGSLPLSSRAGMEFSYDLYRMLVKGQRPESRTYHVGVRCRKLREDVEWFKENARIRADDPFVVRGMIVKKTAREFTAELLCLFSPFEPRDVQVWWDPWPGIVDAWEVARGLIVGVLRKAYSLTRRVFFAPLYRLFRKNLAAAKTIHATRVLFVCHGNIIRSPFAGKFFEEACSRRGRVIEVATAGLHNVAGRPADAAAIGVAMRFGVDLSAHASRVLDRSLVAWADVILAMDASNLRLTYKRFPESRGKTFLLGALSGSSAWGVEIQDPWGRGANSIAAVFEQIAAAIGGVMERVAQGAGRRGSL